MKPAFRKKVIFAAITVIGLVASGYLFFYDLFAFRYGFELGFDSASGKATVEEISPGGAADLAGLRAGDPILQFNGRSPKSELNCAVCISDSRRMPSIRLQVLRDGQATDLVIAGISGSSQAIKYLMALIGLVFVIMGWWVFFARPNYRAAHSWGYFSMLMGVFLLPGGISGSLFDPVFLIASLFLLTAAMFSTACVLDFALVFPMPRGLALRRWTLPLVYGATGVLVLGYLVILLPSLVPGDSLAYTQTALALFYPVFVTVYILYIALAVATLLATYLRTGELEEKRRIRWIIFGTSVPLAILALEILLQNFIGIELPLPHWFLALSLLFIPLANFYAIVRYRAMQMEFILRRGLVYTLVTAAVLLATAALFTAVFALLFVLQDLLPQFGGSRNALVRFLLDPNTQRIAIAIWALVIGATLGRLKRRVQDFVDKRFHRQKYDYRRTLHELASVLDRAGDREQMLQIVLDNAEHLVHPRSVAVALVRAGGDASVECATPKALAGTVLEPAAVGALRLAFENGRGFLGMREMSEENSAYSGLARDSFIRLGADICLRLKREEEVVGFMFLGPKLSELEYNLEDIELLALLADQTARGLEHQRLVAEAAEKERIERELLIGRQIQESLLPASPPRLKGASLAALSIPAMEVGGDFYTFIDYGPKRLGIVAGDIVGKGVAGAINMAATISSIRLIAEESASVSETMQRLNRYLVRNTASRSFAAVLFAVVDLNEMKIRWSNAGLPEPILLADNGRARFLEMERYPYPPGASSRSAYVETEAELKPGDTIVFVTDGVIEIRPADDSCRELGFEGLLGLLSVGGWRDPRKLLDSLADALRKYRKGAEFEDDITAVAVQINGGR